MPLQATASITVDQAITDLAVGLDVYSLPRTRVMSRGRYGRSRQVFVDLSDELVGRIWDTDEASIGISKPTGQTTQ